MAEIFHYTSIESLALILKSRNIRFTRLDGVDDIREAQVHAGVNFGQYFFVSCWTQKKEESIPQWHMYSKNMQGVRIQMPDYPFRRVNLPEGEWAGIHVAGGMVGPLSLEESLRSGYIIAPLYFDDFFCGPVTYVQDVEAHYAAAIRRNVSNEGSVNLQISGLPKLPRLKSDSWEFQDEYRFHLLALPTPAPESSGESSEPINRGDLVSQAFINNVDPGVRYIDVPLAQQSLDELVITMGPKSTTAERIIVEALTEQYAPNAQIRDSALAGSVR